MRTGAMPLRRVTSTPPEPLLSLSSQRSSVSSRTAEEKPDPTWTRCRGRKCRSMQWSTLGKCRVYGGLSDPSGSCRGPISP